MLLKRVSPNPVGRDFVVGDVHGHYDALMQALSKVDFDKSRDRLFGVGDLIDRGPESLKCLQLVHEPWFQSVLGNHEIFMQNALLPHPRRERWYKAWLNSGGDWILDLKAKQRPQLAQDCLARMPYAIELPVGNKLLGIVHAEPPEQGWSVLRALADELDDQKLLEEVTQQVTWSRTRIRLEDSSRVSDIDAVVCGHTIVSKPVQLGNVMYIDTGVRKGGPLTLMEAGELVGMCASP